MPPRSSGLQNHSLVYLPKYVPADDPVLHADEATLKEEFLAGLERMYPDFRRDDLVGPDRRIGRYSPCGQRFRAGRLPVAATWLIWAMCLTSVQVLIDFLV